MSDLPRKAVTRTAKLAALPLGIAGRATWGLGKRIVGESAELVGRELQQRTAEQLFKVLGELKGGAMKFGQALSVFESALPEEVAGPYRAALTKLQDAAPPMPTRTVHSVLEERVGKDWRELFLEFEEKPPPRPRSVRCTARCGTTAVRSPSRCSTRARARRSSRTSANSAGSRACWAH